MDLEPGVSIIRPADADRVVLAANRKGCPVYRFSTQGRSGRTAFFDAVRSDLPVDPPIVGSRSWDALAGSIWEGIHRQGLDCAAVLWLDATSFAGGSPGDFEIAIGVLGDVVRALADEGLTVGRPTEVCVYVGIRQEGDGV